MKFKAFIVDSKDLFDKKNNPELKLSPHSVIENPDIPMKDLDGNDIDAIIDLSEKEAEDYGKEKKINFYPETI